ncbi:DUF6429 family protein [Pseudomonas sp.]|uniref:DUF6429 family protein n=1 Tax=Pseudomonas sp. TaxID=306 RepID=UPI0039C8CA6B
MAANGKELTLALWMSFFENGYISGPKGKNESVYLTLEGMQLAKQLAAKHFSS